MTILEHTIASLKAIQKAEGLTVTEFAAKLGLPRSSLGAFYYHGMCTLIVMRVLKRHYPHLYVEAVLEWAALPGLDRARFTIGDIAEPAKPEEPAA